MSTSADGSTREHERSTVVEKRTEVGAVYDQNVEWYERNRYKGLQEQRYLEQVLAVIPPGGSVLDVGCGMGEPIAGFFIERGYALTGVDISPRMVQRCQQKFPQARFLCADMRTLALGEAFDAVIAWDSLFHLSADDQRKALSVLALHTNPRGVLVFTSGPVAGEAMGEMNGHALYHASLDPKEYKRLLTGHGFDVLDHTVEDPACGDHTVWVAQANPMV